MCHMFEKVTGKKTKGSVGKLEGLTKMYRDAGMNVAIIRIPVELLEIDTRYQIDERTERDLNYLVNNWDERKLLPLVGVPHWKEGKVYIVDGYGRWIASQIVNKEKYVDLMVLLLLDAPQKPAERLAYEAELYAFQNVGVKNVTAVQKHGALMVLHDPATETLERMQKKYGFQYTYKQGNREASVLGSYTEALSLCKLDHGKAAEYVFNICEAAGFDRKTNGYSTYVLRGLRDIYKLYANNRVDTESLFSKELRKISPAILKAKAVTKYPYLEFKTAISLYLEDEVVEKLGLSQSREIVNNKLVPINKPA